MTRIEDLQDRIKKTKTKITKAQERIAYYENYSEDKFIKKEVKCITDSYKRMKVDCPFKASSIKTIEDLINASLEVGKVVAKWRDNIWHCGVKESTLEEVKSDIDYNLSLYWSDKEYGIKEKQKEIEQLNETLNKYQTQLETELAKEASIENLPQLFKDFMDRTVERWDIWDIQKLNNIKSIYRDNTKPYNERRQILEEYYGRGWYDFMYNTEKSIHEQNVKDAKNIVLDLINRVSLYTGEITDYDYLRLDVNNQGYCIINGIVIGKKGKAKVESIEAGGWNIQRWHIRVLVKEVK